MNKVYIVRLTHVQGCRVDYEYSIKAIFTKEENATQYAALINKDNYDFEIVERELSDKIFD